MEKLDIVRVGLGVIIVRNYDISTLDAPYLRKTVLIGKRKGNYAGGVFSFPGGHLEFNETPEDCVYREVHEECGDDLKIKIRPYSNKRLEFFVTNNIMSQYNRHYITIFLVADWISGEADNTEPDKCEGWIWVDLQELCKCGVAEWIPLDLLSKYRDEIKI